MIHDKLCIECINYYKKVISKWLIDLHTHMVQSVKYMLHYAQCIVHSTIVHSLPWTGTDPRHCAGCHPTLQTTLQHLPAVSYLAWPDSVEVDRLSPAELWGIIIWLARQGCFPFEYQAWHCVHLPVWMIRLHSLFVWPDCTQCLYEQTALIVRMIRLHSLFVWSGCTHWLYDQAGLTVCMIKLHSLIVW